MQAQAVIRNGYSLVLPSPVHKLHGLHRQRSGNNVVGVVPAPADHHQPVHLADDKHQAVLKGANAAKSINAKDIRNDGASESEKFSQAKVETILSEGKIT